MPRIAPPASLGPPRGGAWHCVTAAEAASAATQAQRDHALWIRLGWRPRHVTADPLPPRDARGRFMSTRYAGLFPKRCLLGGDFDTPFYLCTSNAKLARQLLPKMLRAKSLGCTATPAWDPLAPKLRGGVRRLLDQIGSVLHRGARLERCPVGAQEPGGPPGTRALSGSDAFAKPLDAGDTCMWASLAMVRAHPSMLMATRAGHNKNSKTGGSYLRVAIGEQPGVRGKPVYERAHRIVAWAMFGPPPREIAQPVAMHTCGDKTCLNPRHIVWGERAENVSRRLANWHAHKRLDKEGRPSPSRLVSKLVNTGFLVRGGEEGGA